MSQELHYTSVPRGLKPGSRGFCSVAWTPEIPGPLVERLEGLSGYQPVYPPHDPAAVRNPINFSHIRLSLGPRTMSVLSRIGPAGLDYTGRANKYAHHVVLEPNERPEGGPAWLLSQPGLLQSTWEGEPRVLTESRPVLRGDRPAGIAQTWQALTGDGGWAGMLAESFLADPRRPVFLVFRPGMELLPLFVEAIALLPTSRRWEVEFSTYLTQLPNGVSCPWRGVLEGSAEARNAGRLPNSLVIDLCRPAGRVQGGALVHLARTGERRDEPTAGILGTVPLGPSRGSVPPAARPTPVAGTPPRMVAASVPENYGLIPELAARMGSHGSLHPNSKNSLSGRRNRRWILISGVLAACLIPLFAAGIFLGLGFGNKPEDGSADGRKTVAGGKDTAGSNEQKVAPETDRSQSEDKLAAAHSDRPNVVTNAVKEGLPPTVTNPDATEHEPKKPDTNKVVIQSQTGATRPITTSPNETPRKPHVLFLSIPEPERQSVGEEGSVGKPSISLADDSASIARIMNLADYKAVPPSGRRLGIQIQSASETADPTDLATFIIDEGRLTFSWGKENEERKELARSLRDSVLKIETSKHEEFYVLLRDPVVEANSPPIPLRGVSGIVSGDGKRTIPFIWAKKPSAFKGTNLRLGIRRWRIVNQLSNEGPKRILANGEEGEELKKEIEIDIKDGDCKLTVRIDPAELRRNRVTLEIIPKLVEPHQRRRGELFQQYKIGSVEKSGPLEVHQQLEDLQARLSRNPKEFNGIELSGEDLSDLKKVVSKSLVYNFRDNCQLSELSLVISLQIDGNLTLDIAQFGEFLDNRR